MSKLPAEEINTKSIYRGGFFALSFGSIVGSGWIILLGEWLRIGAPGGAVLALLTGGALMALIGACYAELAARLPRAGAEFLYAMEVLGSRAAFIVGWFVILFLVAVCAFEGVALAWLIATLFPQVKGPIIYNVFGHAVSVDALAIGLIGAAVVCALNLSGVRSSVLFQRIVTFSFIAVMCGLIVAGTVFGDLSNMQPLFEPVTGRSWIVGFLWILATCAMFLNGFQAALYVIDHRAAGVTVRTVGLSMVAGIIGAAVFYAAIVMSASTLTPWRSILDTDLPAAAAFGSLTEGGLIAEVVLCAALISLAKTWNAVLMMASRMILAQARFGLLPAIFCRIGRDSGAPSPAIWLVTIMSVVGILLGRSALVPIINMATICISMSFVLSLVILLRLRKREQITPDFTVPGGTATIVVALVGATLMAAFIFLEPLLRERGSTIPLEWLLMGAWAILGALLSWRAAKVRAAAAVDTSTT